MDARLNSTGDLEMAGMICKSYGCSVKSTGDLETVGMICKSYECSVKRYK